MNYIKADLYRYNGQTSIKKGLRNDGFRFMYFFRKASNSKKYSPIGVISRIYLKKLSYKYGFQIPIKTEIGKGFYIGHRGPVVINSEAKIGENCNIAHNTTIGQTNRGKLKGCPTLGNNVWIGTGSVIVWKVKIGDNVLIAPNTFVNMDIPKDSLVIGNPAKIVKKKHATDGYIGHILHQ